VFFFFFFLNENHDPLFQYYIITFIGTMYKNEASSKGKRNGKRSLYQ